ncbi:MAG: hypothetical protein E4H27_03440 [Anaerolineales bacterium]|nr:MAG: hypothetical protein E4H27_03440 [Anaerolineales bacterium]
MSENQKFSEAEADRLFAIKHNGLTWDLLAKNNRTPDEDALMIHAAHSSCMHWLQIGTVTHHQRGEWLISHVYSILGYGAAALRHAQVCMNLTRDNPALMQDFDLAYAYEAIARASALSGDMDTANEYYTLAEKVGQAIANDEDKQIFTGDLKSGEWFGLTLD